MDKEPQQSGETPIQRLRRETAARMAGVIAASNETAAAAIAENTRGAGELDQAAHAALQDAPQHDPDLLRIMFPDQHS